MPFFFFFLSFFAHAEQLKFYKSAAPFSSASISNLELAADDRAMNEKNFQSIKFIYT
jgi:hypothetical protein